MSWTRIYPGGDKSFRDTRRIPRKNRRPGEGGGEQQWRHATFNLCVHSSITLGDPIDLLDIDVHDDKQLNTLWAHHYTGIIKDIHR